MPVYVKSKCTNAEIASFAADDWSLPSQIDALEEWLRTQSDNLEPGHYIADIGFSMRKEACGGGAIVSPEAMRRMGQLGISLYLSEYPDD